MSGLLAARRLVTLTGPGGVGKTRLALAVAERLLDQFDDGAYFVALEDADDSPAVLAAVASALEVRERPDRELAEVLADFLRTRQVLLVLDNFEQILSAATFVSRLLESGPGSACWSPAARSSA